MLKGIPTRISSDLLKALADMGHGDLLIIADDFYPPITKTPGGVSIQAKGNSAADMIEDILKLMPLDVVRNGYAPKIVGEIERSKFYEKAGRAYVTVCTSERQPYGCFILQKGVM